MYIINNWTDELLNLMAVKRGERLQRKPQGEGVSTEALSAASGGKIRIVKHGD